MIHTDTPQPSGEQTPLNYSIVNRDSLQGWVLRKLGSPLVTVELTTDMINDAIDESLEVFCKYCKQEQAYYIVNLEKDYTKNVGVKLPSVVQGIADLQEDYDEEFGINDLFTVGNQMWNAGMMPFPGSGGGWTSYELYREYLSLSRRMLGGPHYTFSYNSVNNLLKLYPDPKVEMESGEASIDSLSHICVSCNIIHPNEQLWGEQWVKRMTLAKSKETLGRVRAKFDGVQLLGGGTISTAVLAEGIDDQEKLFEELRLEYPCNALYYG
jgi:hypothetical protein